MGDIPEGGEAKNPWAAKEISIYVSPWVTTNLEVHVFKSEVRHFILLTDASMQFSGTLWLDRLVDISVQYSTWGDTILVIMYEFTH